MYGAQTTPRRVTFGWITEAWQRFTAEAGAWILCTFLYGIITIAVVYGIEMIAITPIIIRTMPAPGAISPDPTAMVRTMLPTFWLIGVFMVLAFILLNAYLGGGLLKMANSSVRNYPVGVGDLFSGRSSFVGLVIYQLIFYIPVYLFSFLLGYPLMKRAYELPTTMYDPFYQIKAMAPFYEMSLLINLGLIVLLGFFWPAAAMIADGENVFTALGRSWGAMKKSWLPSSLLALVVAIVTWVSAIPCFLGLFVTLPMCVLISSLMYRDMVGMPQGSPPGMPGYYGQPPYLGAGYYGQRPADPGIWPPPPGQLPTPPPQDSGNPPPGGNT